MADVNLAAVLAGAVAAFAVGGVYYTLFGAAGTTSEGPQEAPTVPDDAPAARTLVVEALRCLLLAAVVSGLVTRAAVDGWAGGALLGLALWLGFPFVLWTGSVVHERTPWKQAMVHAGDWLVKLPVVAVIAAVWR